MIAVDNVRVTQGSTRVKRVDYNRYLQTPGSVKPGKFGQSSEAFSIVIRREDVEGWEAYYRVLQGLHRCEPIVR